MRKYGISTVSLVPFSLGKKGFEKSLDIVEKLGLNGIQALPMRGWPVDKNYYASNLQEPWDKMILSFEGAWNSGTIRERFSRTASEMKKGYPTFMDWYLFGFNPKSVLEAVRQVFGWQKFIDHKFGDYWCKVEIYPEASTQIQNYLNYPSGVGLVWDTRHVRDKGMPDWRKLLSELPSESIKMIHFQPKDEIELTKFMNGEKNELSIMLKALADKVFKDCPVILEIKPRIRAVLGMESMKSLMNRIKPIRDAVFDILG